MVVQCVSCERYCCDEECGLTIDGDNLCHDCAELDDVKVCKDCGSYFDPIGQEKICPYCEKIS